MHPAALENFKREFNAILNTPPLPQSWRILDMGGQDINGTVHSLVRNVMADRLAALDVLDIEGGTGVTIVGDARGVDWWDGQPYDVVISTEMLEHTPTWPDAIHTAYTVLRPGGWFIGTCASDGRQRHGATGAPEPAPGEWYQNVTASDLIQVMRESRGETWDKINVGYEMNGAPTTHDLHWRARKAL